MSRKIIIGGNWKCNNTLGASEKLVTDVLNKMEFDPSKIEVVVAPVFLHIAPVQSLLKKEIQISAQNCSLKNFGAFTGEIAPDHLIDMKVPWVILGHSERRHILGETNEVVASKVALALKMGLKVIFCIGEQLSEREANQTFNVCKAQMDAVKKQLEEQKLSWENIVIAYEPVWAIGTGKVASPEQAQEVHGYIREYLKENVSKEVAEAMRIQYGGSVNEKNSGELIKQQDIDGFLVGGASLKPEFAGIVKNCQQ